ncbi:MAG TPA: BON domain-containing protein [Anaerolineales bacterium]|nr:BON domain-containing protein [Anaerolineales bacterium]
MNETTDLQIKVRSAILNDPRTKEYGGIEVLDNNGVIILRGIVRSTELRVAAKMIARDVEGVTGVINGIDVKANL